jgi:hypothetical protein
VLVVAAEEISLRLLALLVVLAVAVLVQELPPMQGLVQPTREVVVVER